MSLESWKRLSEIIGLILLAATFIDGCFVWYFTNRVNQEEARKKGPREIPLEKFASILRAARPGKATIEFQIGHPETSLLAQQIAFGLAAGGWTILQSPVGIPSVAPRDVLVDMHDVFLTTGDLKGPSDSQTPTGALVAALKASEIVPSIRLDTSFPKDTVLIAVGPKL